MGGASLLILSPRLSVKLLVEATWQCSPRCGIERGCICAGLGRARHLAGGCQHTPQPPRGFCLLRAIQQPGTSGSTLSIHPSLLPSVGSKFQNLDAGANSVPVPTPEDLNETDRAEVFVALLASTGALEHAAIPPCTLSSCSVWD
eukprot:292332-Amphidinium_carterae.1